MTGFFNTDTLESAPKVTANSLPKCGACGLLKTCKTPKMGVDGDGRKGVLIIGEAPGQWEDQKGIPFIGKSGRLLEQTLARMGVKMRRDCWITNSLICRPPDNETPSDDQIEACRPNVLKAIETLDPHTIILLGAVACKSVLRHLDAEDCGMIRKWAGWRIPSIDMNRWLCPTYHPAYILRDERNQALKFWFTKHLEAAFKKKKKPYKSPPDYNSKVTIIYSPRQAAKEIRRMVTTGGPIAFDFETNMVKPDGQDSEIYAASMSNGKRTIAFPWQGEAALAFKKFLRSPLPKIGANIKFEERWSRAVIGTPVRNWAWDTVQAAHVLDNREKITGVKFQAFVNLGISPYGTKISKYLEAQGSRQQNNIGEADTDLLLQYCGLDALIEYRLALIQSKKLGIDLGC